MNGWLVVNTFVDSVKFKNLYQLLVDAFNEKNISLSLKTAENIGMGCLTKIEPKNKPDFVIFWDKDIYLAQRLENLGIKLFNSSRAIELCDNKILMYQELTKRNIKIPKTFIAPKTFEGLNYSNLDFVKKIALETGYPFILKEAYGSFGQQVYLIKNFDEAKQIIDNLRHKDFLIQEFVSSSFGKDVRINVVGGKAIVSILRENKDDFRSNISNGGKGKKFCPKEKFIRIAEEASNALGCDFCGVDVMFGKNGEPIICELNSNPQFGSTLEATGVNLANYIAEYILKSL